MVLRVLKTIAKILVKLFIICVCAIAVVLSLDALLEWSLPDKYLFYQERERSLFFALLGVLGTNVFIGFHGNWRELWTERKKHCIAFLLAVLFTGYYIITGVTYVTTDTIVNRTLLNPLGTTYKLEEIEKIETGFGDNDGVFFTPEYDKLGNFYYKVYVDGKELVFHSTWANMNIQRYEEDSYLELEEFDQKLESLGIPKEGNPDGAGLCDMDQYYVDRFLRIIGEN